jgi:hypothetical protein
MKSPLLPLDLAREEQAIESKEALLAYLRSQPKRLTLESYLCLTELLRKAGWRHEDQLWQKAELRLPTQAAAESELQRQIAADKDRVLRQTVRSYNDTIRCAIQ